MEQLVADGWVEASIVWIDRKVDEDGQEQVELIYEIGNDPDLLRQMNIAPEQLYPDAKRGDAILVQPLTSSVRPAQTVAPK
jgi:hypothetical protein